MCRLLGFRGLHPTSLSFFLEDASNSLAKQSIMDSRQITNHDGWGIGFYEYNKAFLQKRASCAQDDFNFKELSEFIHTDTMIAHVRHATVGQLSDFNTHPFMFENWIGAHNGTIDSFDELKPEILNKIGHEIALDIKGSTDSETLFHLFIANLKKNVPNITDSEIDLKAVEDAYIETLDYLISLKTENPHKLNFMVTNGKVMLATKYNNSLYYAVREEPLDHRVTLYKDDFNLNIDLKGKKEDESIIIASEPVETEDKWVEIEQGQVIIIDDKLNIIKSRV